MLHQHSTFQKSALSPKQRFLEALIAFALDFPIHLEKHFIHWGFLMLFPSDFSHTGPSPAESLTSSRMSNPTQPYRVLSDLS